MVRTHVRLWLSGKYSDIYTTVSKDDFEYLSKWKWTMTKPNGYVARSQSGKYMVYMHREIQQRLSNEPIQTDMVVDHSNSNRLDNTRENLRLATRSQNCQNQRKQSRKSVYKGVTKHSQSGLWRARIVINGVEKSLGYFKRPKDAAIAYDAAAVKYFGEYAHTNGVTI